MTKSQSQICGGKYDWNDLEPKRWQYASINTNPKMATLDHCPRPSPMESCNPTHESIKMVPRHFDLV